MERRSSRAEQSSRTTVLLVDGNAKLAGLMAQLLEDEPELRVVETVDDAGEAVRCARESRPDVVLVDGRLRGVSPLALCSALRTACPDAVVLVWLSEPDPTLEMSTYVDGVLPRGLTFRELVGRISTAVQAHAGHSATG